MGYNLIKSVIGIGLLSISYTLRQCGWSFLIILCFTSLITLYNAINIGNLVQKYSKEVNYIINYSTLGYFTYGKYFSIFISMYCTIEIYMVSLVVVNLLICNYWKLFIQMMSLTGVILENMTSLILPPILILKADNTLNIYHKILNILIIHYDFRYNS